MNQSPSGVRKDRPKSLFCSTIVRGKPFRFL
jgi:hypothetical protein